MLIQSLETYRRLIVVDSYWKTECLYQFSDYPIFSRLFHLFYAIFFNTLIEKNPNDIRIPNKISNQIKPIKLKIQLYNPSTRIKNFFKKKNGTILLRLILKICFFSWNESFTIECSPTDEGRKHGVIEQMIKPIKIFPIVVYTSWLYDFSGRYTSWLVPTCVRREGEGAGVFEKGGIIPLWCEGGQRVIVNRWLCSSCTRDSGVIHLVGRCVFNPFFEGNKHWLSRDRRTRAACVVLLPRLHPPPPA